MFGNPEWKADDENPGDPFAPLIQCSANQPKKNERQEPKQLDNSIRSPLCGNVFRVVRT